MKDSVTIWLDAASKARKYDKVQTLEALKKLESIDPKSLAYRREVAKICESNLLLVANVVRGYIRKRTKKGWSDDMVQDLLQQAYFGLKRAVEKFEAGKGYQFSTYAVGWIRQAIHRYSAVLEYAVRIPENTLGQIFYMYKHGEMSKRRGLTRNAKLINSARSAMAPVSLDAPIEEDGEALHAVVPYTKPEPTPLQGEHTWASRMLEDKMSEAGIYGESADLLRAYAQTNRLPTAAGRVGLSEKVARPILRAAIKKLESIA